MNPAFYRRKNELGKLILFLIIILIIYWMILRGNRHSKRNKIDAQSDPVENMVRCAYCDIHHPKSETIHHYDKFFCCPEHCSQYCNTPSSKEK